jgi:uncharacterized lipoprotein YehR (DUF1307 family)
MKISKSVVLFVVLVAIIVLSGCGKKGGSVSVDESKPISEIKAEADKMTVDQLREMAIKYRDAIKDKNVKVDKVMLKLRDAGAGAAMTDEFKGIKEEISALTKSMGALKQRFGVYYDKLVLSKADVSDLKLE